jgi:hypothetical protein
MTKATRGDIKPLPALVISFLFVTSNTTNIYH